MKVNYNKFDKKGKPRLLTRKEKRKADRVAKKQRRNNYYTNRGKPSQLSNLSKEQNEKDQKTKIGNHSKKTSPIAQKPAKNTVRHDSSSVSQHDQMILKQKVQENKLKREMKKTRKKQLLNANEDEDRLIKHLEKQMNLNKRKSKTLPKSFGEDGLNYLLEICDEDGMQAAIATEKQLNRGSGDFEDDFKLISASAGQNSDEEEFSGNSDMTDDSDDADANISDEAEMSNDESDSDVSNSVSDASENEEKSEAGLTKKRPRSILEESTANNKRRKGIPFQGDENLSDVNDEDENSDIEMDTLKKNVAKVNEDGTWEDIYGRLRDIKGEVIGSNSAGKYVPPAVREKMEAEVSEASKKSDKLVRAKKKLKGLLNRLAESNMHSIISTVEELYRGFSRHDMNTLLGELIFDSLITPIHTPSRLLIDHAVFIAVLHGNIGTELGAYFLQAAVNKLDEFLNIDQTMEDKNLDNVVNFLAQLYNFGLFHSRLMFDILNRFSEKFEEKEIECILHILRSVGFTLRKDDPLALKELMITLHKKSSLATTKSNNKDNPRINFMLDILLAIKNNNVRKMPQYDDSYPEHMKKIMKGLLRKGNYVTQLNISLDDLLKAEERGRWWIVGSAWSGKTADSVEEQPDKEKSSITSKTFSSKVLELARKQKMNTDIRRTIFCMIITSEDYIDAFVKLIRLGLKNQQEREIVTVILHCAQQETPYNNFYAVLAHKFCDYDRKYQIAFKYALWDKIKLLGKQSASRNSNLAQFTSYLITEKGLPLSVLKVIEFSELDNVTLRFVRQILLRILLHEDEEAYLDAFLKISSADHLKGFRTKLHLFIKHFLLDNLEADIDDSEGKINTLETRGKAVLKLLSSKSKI